ncbi:MAG: glycosyltransferase family 2 protein [Pirellulaceae bacterium]|nr:glycosyltransferase family 2 protein [Planctomycetales bacterium]
MVKQPTACRTGTSVIIPTYNSATSLRRCVESVVSQSLPVGEIQVIDDGSIDNTQDVVAEFGSAVTYRRQENQGQGAARNVGLQVAAGRYIAFLDADDYWQPEFNRRCTEFLEQHADAIAVSTGRLVRKWGQPEQQWPNDRTCQQLGIGGSYVLDDFFQFWADHDHVRTGTVLLRRSAVDEVGLQRPDLRISQDLEYWAMLGTCGKWGLIPEPLWVGEPMSAVTERSWLEKYQLRRKLCPTVEVWQSRVVPRLTSQQWPGFRRVRGRVAANFAQTLMLSGDQRGAWEIISHYGTEMPDNWFVRLVQFGRWWGTPGKLLTSHLVRVRENVKSMSMSRLAKLRG